ncbi:hypothetical protein D3C73_780690 [compost metagenome]
MHVHGEQAVIEPAGSAFAGMNILDAEVDLRLFRGTYRHEIGQLQRCHIPALLKNSDAAMALLQPGREGLLFIAVARSARPIREDTRRIEHRRLIN